MLNFLSLITGAEHHQIYRLPTSTDRGVVIFSDFALVGGGFGPRPRTL